eukprot:g7395.t1
MSHPAIRLLLGLGAWVTIVVTADVDQGLHQAASSERVTKTIVSNQLRLVFAMGLEGTGHHYSFSVEDLMFRTNPDLPRLQDARLNSDLFYTGHIMDESPSKFSRAQASAKEQMKELAKRAEGVPYPGTFQIQRGGLSYPNDNGPYKVFGYIDMRLMAEAAEAEGVDFRVLYLRRSAKDLIIANTVHRNFQDWLGDEATTRPEQRFIEYLKILFTDMGVMHSLLSEIDPAFVVCHDWEYLGNAKQAKKISDFIAPTPEVASRLEETFVELATARHIGTEDLPFGANEVVARLQKKLDAFESEYCGSNFQNSG